MALHIKNMWMKQLCNRKVRDFAMALRARKVSGAFEKRAPGPILDKKNCFPAYGVPLLILLPAKAIMKMWRDEVVTH